MKVYFDNAASTMVCNEAIEAMNVVMKGDFGNPSSMHSFGRKAKKELENAREKIAIALGTYPRHIYFTSGGTESCNLAILGVIDGLKHKGRHIITSAIEHSAVKAPVKKLEDTGWEVTYLKPDAYGRITPEAFSSALRVDTVFASIMLVNNDIGSVNPVGEYAKEIKRRRLDTVLHTDAVQGFCKIPFTIKSLGADLVSVSSHKLYGPKGVGALYIADGVKLSPIMLGGNHEDGKRGGTESLHAAVGFSEAAALGVQELPINTDKVRSLREHTVTLLNDQIPGIEIIGKGDSPYILCISLPGFKSEVLMNYLDSEGICVSKGAACKKGARSPTLEAMNLRDNIIDGALRVSFSKNNTKKEAEYFAKKLKTASQTLVK